MTPHLVICSAICRGGMANWSEVQVTPNLVFYCVSLYSHWLQVFVWLSRYTHIQFPYKKGWTCYHQNPWWWHWSQLFHVIKKDKAPGGLLDRSSDSAGDISPIARSKFLSVLDQTNHPSRCLWSRLKAYYGQYLYFRHLRLLMKDWRNVEQSISQDKALPTPT